MNKKFREVLAKELSLTPEGIAKMFGDYHLNCKRRRANERGLTLRSKNYVSELERARAAVVGLPKAEWQELTLEAASLVELHQGRRSEKN